MYYMYLSEEGHSSGQNAVCPLGLSAQMTSFAITRQLFEVSRVRPSCLAWGHLGRQVSDLMRAGWGKA